MGKHGTATGWKFGQKGEMLAMIARSLGPALEDRDPKEVLEKLGKNGEWLTKGLSGLIGEIMDGESLDQNNHILRLLTPKPLKIKACSGIRIISEQGDLFQAGIFFDSQDYGDGRKGLATEEAGASVYEIVRNATLMQTLADLAKNPDRLYFTEDQVIGFVEEYCEWLRYDGITSLLFKSNGKFRIAHVSVFVPSGGFRVVVRSADEDSDIWSAERHHRLVVLCLLASA